MLPIYFNACPVTLRAKESLIPLSEPTAFKNLALGKYSLSSLSKPSEDRQPREAHVKKQPWLFSQVMRIRSCVIHRYDSNGPLTEKT